MKTCPFCAEEIQDAAIKCRYCGSMLDRPAALATPASQPITTSAAPRDEFEDIRDLVRQDKKFEAIELYEAKTGRSLWESKDAVEALAKGQSTIDAGPGPILMTDDGVDSRQNIPDVATAPKNANVAGGKALILILGILAYFAYHLGDYLTPASWRQGAQPSAQSATVTPAPVPEQDSAAADSARAAISTMVKNGLIKRMDVQTGKFYINGPLWEGFELDAKQNIVKVISGYRDAEHGLPQVTLYESRNGKELASFGVFGGVTIR